MTTSPEPSARYQIGDFFVDCGQRRVCRGQQEIALGKLTFDLLIALVDSAPNLVTQEELAGRVWADRIVSPETIAQRVKILRQSLGDDAHDPRYIRVIRGQGYQLIPRVERASSRLEETGGTALPLQSADVGLRRTKAKRIVIVAMVIALAAAAATWETVNLPKTAPLASAAIGYLAPSDGVESAVNRFSVSVPATIRQGLRAAPRSVLAVSPDGRRVVFIAGQLTLRSLDSLTLKTIPGTSDAHQPFFSPDGAWVAYFTSTGELKKVHVGDGASPVTLARGIPNSGSDFGIWRSDGTIIYSTGDSALSQVAADGGLPKRVELGGESGQRIGGPMAIVSGTDDLLLTFGRGPKDTRVELYDWRAHRRFPIVENAWLAAFTSSNRLLFVRDGLLMAAALDVRTRTVGPMETLAVEIEEDVVGVIRQFAVSPNGTLVYLAARGAGVRTRELGRMSRSGDFTPLMTLPPMSDPYTLDVSSDFRFVLTTGARNLDVVTFLFDIDRRVLRRLGVQTQSATWHRDGRRVVLGGRRGLRIWDSEDATETVLAENIKDAHSVRFGQDGRSVVYKAPRPDDNIYAFDIETRKERAILNSAADERLPTVSPDGRLIAYVSDETGQAAVHVARFPDADNPLVVAARSSSPVWSADGSELYFAADNPSMRRVEMQSVAVSTGDTLEVSPPRTLFAVPYEGTADGYQLSWGNTESPMFDVAPDNEHFLMVRFPIDRAETTAELVIVQNWLRELNRLVPSGG